jgi:hypothetical protein
MRSDVDGARWIRMRLLNVRVSRRFRRFDVRLARLVSDERVRNSLRALMLVEMSARPTLVRAGEWLAWWASGKRVAATRGPFQLRNAPWSFSEAVRDAEQRVADVATDADLARLWYGRAGREPGSRVAYLVALTEARAVLAFEADLIS